MDIRGIWKVKEIRVPTPDGEKILTPDCPPEEEQFEGSAELMQYRTEFAEDGVLITLDSFAEIPVTEDGCLLYGHGMILLERV